MSSANAAAFRAWALDPTRTNDELYTVELLIDWGRVVWGWKHEKPKPTDWESQRAHDAERKLNPAYRPTLDLEQLDATVEVWDRVVQFAPHLYDGRPIRDLAVLRFFPHLEKVEMRQCEVKDLSPILALRNLQSLTIAEPYRDGGFAVDHLEAATGLPELTAVSLNLRTPWIDLSFLATLPQLQNLSLHLNLLNLAGLGPLPKLESATLHSDFHCKTPLRRAADLPEMPLVRVLKIDSIASLEGLERYPALINLELEGPFRDLSPLAHLSQLTFIKLTGEQFTDLHPLARPPVLREIVLQRERPLDITPLAEAPALRELKVENCPVLETEVAALNAALLPWSGDFLAPEPRPLRPPRLIVCDRREPAYEEERKRRALETNAQYYRQAATRDAAVHAAGERWFQEELQNRLERLLGVGWGIALHTYLNLRRYRDVMRLPEIVTMLREFSSVCQEPTTFVLIVEPHGDMSEDMEAIRRRQNRGRPVEEEKFNARQEKEDWDEYYRRRREQRAFLEREYRLKILEEQGTPIDPGQFSPSAAEPTPAQEKALAGGESEAENDDPAEDESDLMEAPLELGESTESELARDLSFYLTVTEGDLLIDDNKVENASALLDNEMILWKDLPEPVEQRLIW